MDETEKAFETLLIDVKNLMDGGLPETMSSDQVTWLANMGGRMALHLKSDLDPRKMKERPDKTIYASELGAPCVRKVYYAVREPGGDDVIPLETTARVKFLYGDMVEELALSLAKFSGHKVEDTQKSVDIPLADGWTLHGRLDAKIDGVVVDVKSCSSRAYQKYVEQGLTPETDMFGYMYQLATYMVGTNTKEGAFWFVCRDTGEMHFEGIQPDNFDEFTKEVVDRGNSVVAAISGEDVPERLADRPFGKGGNRQLATGCAYCQYRNRCWPEARTFIYSNGPVYLSEVKKEPKVPELKKDGYLEVPSTINEGKEADTEAPLEDPPF